MDIASFEADLRAKDFGEIETKKLAAGTHNAEHAHPFEVRALVLDGQISLMVSNVARTYMMGDVFTMAEGCRHIEEIGPEGVSYLVGRKRTGAG